MGSDRAPSPVGLSSLPNETLLLILRNFCLHCRETLHETPHADVRRDQQNFQPSWYQENVSALHSMCLVSRRFLPLAQEVLYHEFCPGYGGSWQHHEWEHRLARFLRTAARRLDLASLVERLYINHNLLNCITEDEAESQLKEAAEARSLHLPDFLSAFQNQLHPALRGKYRPRGDELVGMLLACLPNLKTLAFSAAAPYKNIPSSALSAAGISSLPIQTLDLCGSELSCRLHDIFRLASSTLRTLNLDSCHGFGDLVTVPPHHLLGPTNLRNLCITNSRCSRWDFRPLLNSCSGLEVFSYGSFKDDDFLQWSGPAYLVKHKDSLRTLYLDIRPPRSTSFYNWARVIVVLKRLAALRHVFINSKLIYFSIKEPREDGELLTRFLPPSIVSLHLAGNLEPEMVARLARGLLHLAWATSQRQYPNLKEVRCDAGQRFDDYGLDDAFAQAGVDFEYDTWPTRRADSRSNSVSFDDEESVWNAEPHRELGDDGCLCLSIGKWKSGQKLAQSVCGCIWAVCKMCVGQRNRTQQR